MIFKGFELKFLFIAVPFKKKCMWQNERYNEPIILLMKAIRFKCLFN